MYGINEIKKQNVQNDADLKNSRDGTFAVLRDGSILIRSGIRSKNLEGSDASEFLDKVRDKSTGFIRETVKSYF